MAAETAVTPDEEVAAFVSSEEVGMPNETEDVVEAAPLSGEKEVVEDNTNVEEEYKTQE
jgi:hypothetical protein